MKNILIKGSPGTGKTYISRALAYYICSEKLKISAALNKDMYGDLDKIEKFIDSDFCEFIQVHRSMSFDDIVYGMDIKAGGTLSVSYAEKRIKKICDKASKLTSLHCIIFDDIGRTDAGVLLGNLMYAIEYRNQEVELVDGTKLSVPDNIIFIFTECNNTYGKSMDYALRRRMEFVLELKSDKDALNRYYNGVISNSAKNIILDVYDSIRNYFEWHIDKDASINPEDYIPGHGLFIVKKLGTSYLVLDKIKQKIVFQICPYMMNLYSTGILSGDVKTFCDSVINRINTGIASVDTVSTVEKMFAGSRTMVPIFSLADSKNYYNTSIIPNNCVDKRDIMECIIDAILLNDVLPKDIVFSELLENTNVASVQSSTLPTEYASYIVDISDIDKYVYETPKKTGGRAIHWYYSSETPKGGRWKPRGDTIAYSVSYNNGTLGKVYLPVNGFRIHSFTVNATNIDTGNNPAEIFRAVYRLIEAYLNYYEANIALVMMSDKIYIDIHELILLEIQYLKALHKGLVGSNDNTKWNFFGSKLLNFQTLWNTKDADIYVDGVKFDNLQKGITPFDITSYEGIYSYTAATKKTIELKGVVKMADLSNYQSIMENIDVRQMIFQGPPGTSKTFESKKFVLKQLNPSDPVLVAKDTSQEKISDALRPYKLTADDYNNPSASSKFTSGGWDLVQFHPSYGYEDFIRGINVEPTGSGLPSYESVNRILGKIAEFAKIAENANPVNAPKFYLVVDEINRANLATVLGELIYGLEYRNSFVSTPYEVNDKVSGKKTKDIVIGKNLFIIGTMNTADKSIDAIDYAVRRRFIFIDSPARRDVVIDCYKNISGNTDENSIELLMFDGVQKVFDDDRFFNDEYQKSDVKLGHTYFLRNKKTGYVDDVIQHFVFQVVPILREYVKDGILDPTVDLIPLEHSALDIKNAPDDATKIRYMAENIMLYVKEFGNKIKPGVEINNGYIGAFIEDLSTEFGY